MIYSYPRLSNNDLLLFRFLGPGLGNLLFPWARALVHAEDTGHRLIAPTWPQLKAARLLRGDRDSRLYRGFFTSRPTWITGLARARLLLTAPRVPEERALEASEGSVIEFSGMSGHFGPFIDRHSLIRDNLLEMTLPAHKAALTFDFRDSISLHVRMGDFAVAASRATIAHGAVNVRIPIEWYVSIVRSLRDALRSQVKVHVFSDGTDEELRELLQLPGVQRLHFGSAIGDLIGLSRSTALVASGSTFSMWASFLGRMPVVWHPGQLKQPLYFDSTFEREIAGDQSRSSAEALDALAAALLNSDIRL